MTEQTNKIHPMASSMFAFVNESLTLEELEARLTLMKNVVENIEADLEKIKNPEPEVTEEAPPSDAVEADEVIESPEERRQRLIAEYAASLEEGAE